MNYQGKKRFRKIIRKNYNIEDEISKLEFFLRVSPKTRRLSSRTQNYSRNSEKLEKIRQLSNQFNSNRLTETNQDNIKTLFGIYRKKYN